MVKKRILYLYLKTGNGHLSNANAMSHAVAERYPNTENVVADALPETTGWFRRFLEEGYRSSVHEMAWIWPIAYELGRIGVLRHLGLALLRPFVKAHLRDLISAGNYSTIVSVHFLLSPIIDEVLRELNLSTKTITVVTDPFTPHPFWFMHKNQNLVVFSDAARDLAVASGFPREAVLVLPVMTKTKYERRLTAESVGKLRKELSVPEGSPVVLIAGGGDGLPHADKILDGALAIAENLELFVVCGNNLALADRCRNVTLRHRAEGRVRILGLIDTMYELMNIANVVITKGGPATVMEALFLEKPILLSHYIYGQEQGNVDFVSSNSVGYYVPNRKELLQKLRDLLTSPELVKELVSSIRKLELVNGTGRLAEFVAEL